MSINYQALLGISNITADILEVNTINAKEEDVITSNITTANITNANITNAKIDNLTIVTITVDTANIGVANIGTANTTTANTTTENVHTLVFVGTGGNTTITGNATSGSTFVFPGSNGSNHNILQTDGSGNSSWTSSPTLGNVTMNEIILLNGSNNTTVNAPAGINTTFILPSNIGSNHNILQTGGSGATSWTSAPTLAELTLNSTGSYYCNLYGPSLGNSTLTLPSSNGSNNNLMQTDGSGNISWTGTPSINSMTINNSGNHVTLSANSTGTSNFQFPANGGTNGYVLSTDGSGNTSWISASTGIISSAAVGAFYYGATTLTLSGVSQNVPGLSASITLPSSGNYHIRADYTVNLINITLNSNVYCFASSTYASGAGTGQYIQAFSGVPSSTTYAANVLSGSGFLNYYSGVIGSYPYSFTGGSTISVYVKIYTSSSLSTTVTYWTGEPDASGAYFEGSNLVLSCVPA